MCGDLTIIKIACFRHFWDFQFSKDFSQLWKFFQTAFSTTCANFCKCVCVQPAPYLVERIFWSEKNVLRPLLTTFFPTISRGNFCCCHLIERIHYNICSRKSFSATCYYGLRRIVPPEKRYYYS